MNSGYEAPAGDNSTTKHCWSGPAACCLGQHPVQLLVARHEVCCPQWRTPPQHPQQHLEQLPTAAVALLPSVPPNLNSLTEPSLTPKPNLHLQQWCQQASKQDDCAKEGCVECVVGVECLLADGWQEGQGTQVLLPLNLHTRWLIVTLDTGCGGRGWGQGEAQVGVGHQPLVCVRLHPNKPTVLQGTDSLL